jgi:hypothetical protein
VRLISIFCYLYYLDIMTNASHGRSIVEVLIATIFVCFLTGFVAVLCIGNYYRAKKAMERHRQRRLARLSHGAGGNVEGMVGNKAGHGSPGSNYSNTTSGESLAIDERKPLLSNPAELPRRRNNNINDDLLLFTNNGDEHRQPNIIRV